MKLLLYCTKAKPYITISNDKQRVYPSCVISDGIKEWHLNGKIVAECDFEVDTIVMQKGAEDRIYGNNGFMGYGVIKKNGYFNWYNENKACLTEKELFKYLEGFEKPYLIPTNYKCKNGYAIHIKNLHIFDKPRELSEHWIKQAPQNMCYGWCQSFAIDERVIIISIRPEWLCKILNGEKTIEVRKKVLKEMLK